MILKIQIIKPIFEQICQVSQHLLDSFKNILAFDL